MKKKILLALFVTPMAFAAPKFYYNAQEGACINRSYEFGHNIASSGECRDLRDEDVSEMILKGNNKGLNISGSVEFWEDDLSPRKQKKIGGLKAAEGADLSGINLSNTNGVEDINLRPNSVKLSKVKMRGANLSDSNLYRIDLSASDISGLNAFNTNLMRANLNGAQIDAAKFNNAKMQNVNLEKTVGAANFRNANLTGANLKNAILHNTHKKNKFSLKTYKLSSDFQGAILKNADLRGADLSGSNLKLAKDLSGAKFDVSNAHLLPFSVDDAIERGMIPYYGDDELSLRELKSFLLSDYSDSGVRGISYMYPLTRLIEGERPFGIVDDRRELGKDFDTFIQSEGYEQDKETGSYKSSRGSFSIGN